MPLRIILSTTVLLALAAVIAMLGPARRGSSADPLDALRDAQRLLKMLGELYTQVVNRDLVR